MNQALCNKCTNLVPAQVTQRGNQMFLQKECPDCGRTESLISSDAGRYNDKRSLAEESPHIPCGLGCRTCKIHKNPNLLFVDITNLCNLNCPICINNTPSMGFLFEPPIEYFERIFDHYAKLDPPPSFQLFGGEPTVREDLPQIIAMARARGLATRVVTNGMKLADEDYCRKLIATRATLCFAYDNDDPATYRVHRGNEKILAVKLKAIDNIVKIGKAKVVLMSLVAKGYNDKKLPRLFQFCHDRRECIRAINFMLLAHTWDDEKTNIEAERITPEDIELCIADAFPQDRIDFLPASFVGLMPTLAKALKIKPLPFAGAHPNCESMYVLVSDGNSYAPIGRYLKTSVLDLARDLIALEKRLSLRWRGRDAQVMRASKLEMLRVGVAMVGLVLRNARLGSFLKGRGPGKAAHAAGLLWDLIARRCKFRHALVRHTTAQSILQLIVLPFEDQSNLETDRLVQCPTGFAFIDPVDDQVKHVPTCAWSLVKTKIMADVMEKYPAKAKIAAGGASLSSTN